MRASIVIRALNEARHIGRLLDSIRRQSVDFEYEVVLVDSGSSDPTVRIAREHGAHIVEISPEDFTFGYSLNRGIEVASGEVCVLVSAHCEAVDEFWLAGMVQPFDDPAVALVYGCQRGKETTQFSEHRIFEKWFPDDDLDNQQIPFCNNANAAIRRSVWVQTPYDEQLTGLEDIDWGNKILAQGHVIHYRAAPTVYHIHEERFSQVINRYRREALALRDIYPNTSFGLWDFSKLYVMNVVGDSLVAIRRAELMREIVSILRFRFCQFWGTWLAHRTRGRISRELRRKLYYPKRPTLGSSVRGRTSRERDRP